MQALKCLGVAAVVLVSFFGVRWFSSPHSSPSAEAPSTAAAALPAFHRVDPNDPRVAMQRTAFVGDGDAERDGLRYAALEDATKLSGDPCNPAFKASYVAAATAYARAWLSIAPCAGTSSCGAAGDSRRIDQAAQAFGSPLDRRVRDAMARAHGTGVLTATDFPPEVVGLLAGWARDPMLDPRASTAHREVSEALGETHPSLACNTSPAR
jgi:hypothetical protein